MDWRSLIGRINKRFIKNKRLLCDLIKRKEVTEVRRLRVIKKKDEIASENSSE